MAEARRSRPPCCRNTKCMMLAILAIVYLTLAVLQWRRVEA